MKDPAAFSIARVAWSAHADALRAVRKTVFVVEQRVPAKLEWDGIDDRCVHVLARSSSGAAIGTGRLLPDGHIGRMAVLKRWRGRGVGSGMLVELLAAAREHGFERVELSAQTHALGFYRRQGFTAFGGEYLEAGIPHRAMRLKLVKRKRT